MKDLVLKHALRLLLQQYDLVYTFENRVLLITNPLLAEGKPVLQVHDVRDLIAEGHTTCEQLESLIRASVSPASWTSKTSTNSRRAGGMTPSKQSRAM